MMIMSMWVSCQVSICVVVYNGTDDWQHATAPMLLFVLAEIIVITIYPKYRHKCK